MSVTISYPSTQFEELYGPFVNLGTHLPPKDNSPFENNVNTHMLYIYIYNINQENDISKTNLSTFQ